MAQVERLLVMTSMTVLMVVATMNLTGQIESKVGGAGVQRSCSSGGRSIAKRGGRHGADAPTFTLLMDLVLDIVLICPVALVVPTSGSTVPGEPV